MDVLAAVRPDDWNLTLFFHVLGAMVFTGVLVMSVIVFATARAGAPGAVRLGYRTLLMAGIPAYLVMRVFAQLIADKENVSDSDAAWITIGYMVTEPGLLLMIIALVCSGIASRRLARGESPRKLITASFGLTGALLGLYVIALWAMTTKPE